MALLVYGADRKQSGGLFTASRVLVLTRFLPGPLCLSGTQAANYSGKKRRHLPTVVDSHEIRDKHKGVGQHAGKKLRRGKTQLSH